ncbi:MAG: hypothetical protein HY246_08160 [Proteobacteria bacterium]|nr:hypothetical protein [Pseudomonadota bacterium]
MLLFNNKIAIYRFEAAARGDRPCPGQWGNKAAGKSLSDAPLATRTLRHRPEIPDALDSSVLISYSAVTNSAAGQAVPLRQVWFGSDRWAGAVRVD